MSFYRYCFLGFLLVIAVACGSAEPLPSDPPPPTAVESTAEPTELPPPPVLVDEDPTQASPETAAIDEPILTVDIGFEYNGIFFDPGGLGNVVVAEVAQQTGEGAPFWAIHPAYTAFQFDGYPLNNSRQMAQLSVYPAADFANLNPNAREMIADLEVILVEKPADFSEREIPQLPLLNAAQVFRTQIEYVPFVNGEGVRFVTYYSQGIDVISNVDIFYSFQGLTSDGAYYVSAVLPVDSPTLPEQPTTIEDIDVFAADYNIYLDAIIADLDALTADAFLPTLGALDQLIMSLDVNPTAAPPPTTAEGAVALAISQPPTDSQLPVGETAAVTGFLPAGLTEPIQLSLQAGANTLISTTVQSDVDTGTWTAELPIPLNVTGPALLIAATPSETVVQSVTLYDPTPEAQVTQLMLDQPFGGEVAVEGVPLFFHGRVTNPINETVTIGVTINGCREFIARQSFTLAGGTWNGQVILPAEVTGPACVVVYTGEYGVNWQEVSRPLTILSRGDELAPRVTIGNSFNVSVAVGGSVTLYGAAVAPPEGELTVALKDTAGTIVAEMLTTIDGFGYWETTLTLPADYAATSAIVTAFFEEDEERYFVERGIGVQ